MLKIYREGTALIGSRSLPGWEAAPIGEYIDGLLGRPIDRENAVLKWDAWAKRSGEEVPSEVWAALGVWDRVVFEIQGEYPWAWLDYYREFRKSDVFQQYIKDVGVYQIWQERGFPPLCQPEGEHGFSCP